MKKKSLCYVCLALLLLACFIACSNDDNSSTQENVLLSTTLSGCKDLSRSSETSGTSTDLHSEEVIKYNATSDKGLILEHQNVIFGCEAKLTTNALLKNHEIIISESDKSITDCICTYDLTMKIGSLNEGSYRIVIIRDALEYASFTINYAPGLEGEFIVKHSN